MGKPLSWSANGPLERGASRPELRRREKCIRTALFGSAILLSAGCGFLIKPPKNDDQPGIPPTEYVSGPRQTAIKNAAIREEVRAKNARIAAEREAASMADAAATPSQSAVVSPEGGGADAGVGPAIAVSVAACADRRAVSECFKFADEKSFEACADQCIDKIDDVENTRSEQVQAACEERVIAENAAKPLTCGFGPPAPREDVKKLLDALKRATLARSPDADALFVRTLAIDTAKREASCTEDCNKRGKSRVMAPVEGPGLVRQYKVCMVNAVSTMRARKLALYERDLYDEFVSAASKRCREASRCDWLEKFSSLECTYNPL